MAQVKLQVAHWLQARFELSRGGLKENLRCMEGLRGLAVFLVFLTHYNSGNPMTAGNTNLGAVSRQLAYIGSTGVDLFFVLSGFLIYGMVISRSDGFVSFMSRRAKRIYPAFIVVLTVYVLLSLAAPEYGKIGGSLHERVLYLAENALLLPGLFPVKPMIAVSWTLSYEVFYYLAIPLVVTALALRSRTAVWRVLFFASVAAAAVIVYCAGYSSHRGDEWGYVQRIRLIMFVAGILCYEALESRRIRSPGSFIGLCCLVVGMLSTFVPGSAMAGNTLHMCILFVSYSMLCLACFKEQHGWLAGLFSQTPLRWFGNMSYSYYLTHNLTLRIAFHEVSRVIPSSGGGPVPYLLFMPIAFIATLGPALLLYLIVERPLSLASGTRLKEARVVRA